MRSLEKRFKIEKNKNSNLSDVVCFAKAIKGQKFLEKTILEWFHIIDREDYKGSNRKELVEFMVAYSNAVEGKVMA